MVIQAVCARAEEMGVIMTPTEKGGMKGKKDIDNRQHLFNQGGNDQTYLARKIMTDSPPTKRPRLLRSWRT